MANLTPNVDVAASEDMALTILKMVYLQVGRDKLVELIDNPNTKWDDHALAAADGAAGLIPPWNGE